MWLQNFIEVQPSESHKIRKKRKNKMYLKVIDSSEMYCLSDIGDLHSSLKMIMDFSIHKKEHNKQKNIKSSSFI